MLDAMKMNEKLEEIGRSVNTLMQVSLATSHETDVTSELTKIWESACSLQRAISTPAIVEGYRLDTIEQMWRIGELISELSAEPQHHELLEIGMAAELAVEKLRTYEKIAAIAAKTELLTGVRNGMDRAAA